jgi:integrase
LATRIIRTGKGHKLKHNVPRSLLKLAGQTAWVKWLDKNYSTADAEQMRAAFDLECTALVRQLNRLSPDDREKLIKVGGLRGADGGRANFERLAIRDLESFNDADTVQLFEALGVPHTRAKIDELHGKYAVVAVKAKRGLSDREKAIAARDKMFVAQRKDGLYTLADLAEALEPTLSVKGKRRARLYIKRLIEHLGGDRKPETIRQSDIVAWRDAMAAAGVTRINQQQHLNKMSGLFGRALSEGKIAANPVKGIKPKLPANGETLREEKRAFAADELSQFLAGTKTAAGDVAIIAECLLYTGARSSEIAGLRVEDVRTQDGMLIFDFNTKYRTLKKGAKRLVPVPSILEARIEALTRGRAPDALLFEKQTMSPNQDAGHWWQKEASKIIRSFCKDPSLTGHGLRHLWIVTADKLKIDDQVSYAITGHAKGNDVHSRVYRKRPDLGPLKDGVENVAHALVAAL